MLSFNFPWIFIALPLPLLVYFLIKPTQQPQLSALKVANNRAFPSVSETTSNKSAAKLVASTLVWLLLIVSSAQPMWIGEPITQPTQARELILAVDLSASMQEDDMKLNGRYVDRLTMVKSVLADFIAKRQGDRIGLILFADNAYVQAPLTFDLTTVQTLLDESFLGLVGQRTAIGEAIGLAVKRFDNKEDSNRVLVLLTDGENTAGSISPEQALELAIAKDVTIYTIGVGSENNRQFGFFNRSTGVDEESLTDIALATNGKFFKATDSDQLEDIYSQLDALEKIEANEQTMRPQQALFYWPLAIAMLIVGLLLVSVIIREQK
ncbi:VWA domain-containing protein [Psychrobium sp. MM17-31]|uniref:vWA domain-containing protein n=1 Tax=Psychrobium sp. MM17-31 TaxID=2917758 RepID=UPI001EF3E419|nr:VWA domain-containing protein [Psychrobium sp. MM17-31]MCG7531734.1 VWA domain-containing protein [Psychrobium sp. MM17-31]